MSEEQIEEQAYAYLNDTYWKSPEDKTTAKDVLLGFLDFMFASSGGENK